MKESYWKIALAIYVCSLFSSLSLVPPSIKAKQPIGKLHACCPSLSLSVSCRARKKHVLFLSTSEYFSVERKTFHDFGYPLRQTGVWGVLVTRMQSRPLLYAAQQR